MPRKHIEKVLRDKSVRRKCTRYLAVRDLLEALHELFPEEEYHFLHVDWILQKHGSDIPIDDPDQHGARPLDQQALSKLTETFNSFDVEGGGTINEEELGKALKAMGYPDLSKKQLRAKLISIDRDNSGDIDLDEFCDAQYLLMTTVVARVGCCSLLLLTVGCCSLLGLAVGCWSLLALFDLGAYYWVLTIGSAGLLVSGCHLDGSRQPVLSNIDLIVQQASWESKPPTFSPR